MGSDSIDVIAEVNRLVATGGITVDTLHLILRIDHSRLRAALDAGTTGQTSLVSGDRPILTSDEIMRLSMLTAQLTEGMAITDDVRLKAMLESLISELNFDSHSIARLVGLPIEDVELVIADAASAPNHIKYPVAMRCSYVITAVNLSRGR